MQMLKIADLIPHPRNNEFFDDMSGEKWDDFLESVKTSGIIEPIVVTQNMVIISGHQRVRACKELGIEEILAEVRIYDDEQKIVKDLIETNVRQRGMIPGSDRQIAARVNALREVYGIAHGGNRSKSANCTLEDIAAKAGTDVDKYKRASVVCSTIPEVQELLETGIVSSATVRNLIAKLSDEEQERLVESLPQTGKITEKQMEKYIADIKRLEGERDDAEHRAAEAEKQAEVAVAAVREAENLPKGETDLVKLKAKLDSEMEKSRKHYEDLQTVKKELAQTKKERDQYDKARKSANEQNERLKAENQKLSEAEPKVIEKKVLVDVIPDDYEDLKRQVEELERENGELAEFRAKHSHDAEESVQPMTVSGLFEQAMGAFIQECGSISAEPERLGEVGQSLLDHYNHQLNEVRTIANALLKYFKAQKKEVA